MTALLILTVWLVSSAALVVVLAAVIHQGDDGTSAASPGLEALLHGRW